MPEPDQDRKPAVRERVCVIGQHEERPDRPESNPLASATMRSGDPRGQEHESMEDEEKVLAGRADVNMPALLTKDVPGG
jgi:hypothetical protein